eukprot:Clim_evm70s146 gene=Clim_evmTU70s146
MDPNTIAKEFTGFYYQKFVSTRQELVPLYQPDSCMQWEGQLFQGPQAIMDKFGSLSFQQAAFALSCVDAQPTDFGLLVTVLGQFMVDDGASKLPFVHVFHLKKAGDNLYISNEVFRMAYFDH